MRVYAGANTLLGVFVAALIASSVLAQEVPYNVNQIQRALVDRGYNIGSVDGLWGRRSINALAAFQRSEGLPATGELNDETVERLLQSPQAKAMAPARDITPDLPAGPALSLQAPVMPAPVQRRDPEPLPSVSLSKEEAVPSRPVDVARQAPAPASAPARNASPPGTSYRPGWIGVAIIAGVFFVLVRRGRAARRAEAARARDAAGSKAPPRRHKQTVLTSVVATPPKVQPKPVPATGHMSEDLKASIATHNESVGKAINFKQSADDLGLSAVAAAIGAEVPMPVELSRADDASPLDALKASVAAHNASVGQAIRAAPEKARDRSFIERLTGSMGRDTSPQRDGWIPANQTVTVCKHVISGGLIYVGSRLPQSSNNHQAENCLINPRLAIASRGDPGGHTMGYWPSYSEITAEARRSYLDWLAGPRSDPSTYIGYVFLYFYGLERRLMLEQHAPDAERVLDEVRRLLRIYGSHHSFRRYAQDLLSSYELQTARDPEPVSPGEAAGSYEVPLSIKAALGVRVRDGRAIEADLLLAYVMAHPETSVRTPAKRALEELRTLFALELGKRNPDGFMISASRAKRLTTSYRACSGTFEVEISPFGGDLPDISGHSRPLKAGRELLEICTGQLEDYSRAVGRTGGPPTLAILARLPLPIREVRARLVANAPLRQLEALSGTTTVTSIEQLRTIVGSADGTDLSRGKLRDLAGVLAAFGFGITADPAFAARTAKADEPVVLFRLSRPAATPTELEPSPHYAHMQATLMLALLVATVDGALHEQERQGLIARVAAAKELPEDERRRLMAELVAQASSPGRLSDWMKRLKDLEAVDGDRVADMLVAAAAADGRIEPGEVALLEKLFSRLGLEASALYTRLHGGIATPLTDMDSELPVVVPAGQQPAAASIPPPPTGKDSRPALRVDLSRLEAIRRETRSASGVLANIFAEEETAAEPEILITADQDTVEDVMFEGLEGRYGCLLADLAERDEWSSADFEQLARQAGLMPGAARQILNDWSLDRYDELVLEGEDVVLVNRHLLPSPSVAIPAASVADSRVDA